MTDAYFYHLKFDNTDCIEGLISEKGVLDVTVLMNVVQESMQKCLRTLDSSQIPLRAVEFTEPWLMVYEGQGKSKGMLISFDVIPVIEIPQTLMEEDLPLRVKHRQGQILSDPILNPMRVFLKRSKLDRARFNPTYARSELNIMDCLPVEPRLGVVMVKSLLRQFDDCPITSYMVKTALFYAIHDKIRSGVMKKLEKSESRNHWITNSDAKHYHEEGRRWAIDIVHHIKTIKGSFLDNGPINNIMEAAAYCDRVLELF